MFGMGLIFNSVGDFFNKNNKISGKGHTRSDCTYLLADLAVHSPQNISIVANGRIRVSNMIDFLMAEKSLHGVLPLCQTTKS